jgi:putative phosphoesterase
MTVALVLADTHLRHGQLDRLSPAVWELADAADVILHAGDVVEPELLDELATRAPVHAVLGNNDRGLDALLPDRLTLELGGVEVAMVHDSGARGGRARRMDRWFPEAGVVVFGHSHDPVNERTDEGHLLFNPGSPTQRRRQPHRTVGILELDGGEVARAEIVVVD